jgi:uncharacterized membrane protein YgdD (TMEM256/DUF423 family)
MNPHAKCFLVLGGLNASIAVALGAAATHALSAQLAAGDSARWFALGLQYHQYHALGLILVGLATASFSASRCFLWAGWLMFSGILLFSGDLYLLSLAGIQFTRPAIPFGGAAFIAAWLLFAMGSCTALRQSPARGRPPLTEAHSRLS